MENNKIIWNRGEIESLIGRNFTGEFNSFDEIQKALDCFEKIIVEKYENKVKELNKKIYHKELNPGEIMNELDKLF